VLDRLLLPPRPLAALAPEEQPAPALAEAQQAALPSSVRADLRWVHP
jgi:hypothetical protein